MENVLTAVPLIVFIPIIGLVINLFWGKHLGEAGVGIVAVAASGSAFMIAVFLWAGLVANDYTPAIVNLPLLDGWIRIPSANVDIPWQFRVDTLSVTMMLVVTGVGTMIHIYAIGYMHGDSRFPRFFVYLNLFLAFMLVLVSGNNFLMMFVGWEGVGLCSYLLIGFWFDFTNEDREHPGQTKGWSNSNAARKAFIVNRIGDFGLLIAMFLAFWTFGTLDFYTEADLKPIPVHHEAEAGAEHGEEAAVEESAHGETAPHAEAVTVPVEEMGVFNKAYTWLEEGGHKAKFGSIDMSLENIIVLITLFLLLGATGKSAQIPLFVWLPDAMAGPTPVSALIHAATMVTAGVYMMVRANVLFHSADFTSFIVTVIGAGTAIMAGFIAVGQWDIKRVLAYSTISQLGFMVAAVGIGGYVAAIFHLMTHAFFKALLFLASGSVIHGVEHGHHHVHEHHEEEDFDPQDMRNMGGLRHRMPITYWTYVFGTLALAGVFPFAGFWSKDEILADSLRTGWNDGKLQGFLALIILAAAAAFTAFYMWRQVSLVFYGEARHEAAKHAPESVRLMTVPLMVLAFFSLFAGFFNTPANVPLLSNIFGAHRFTDWLGHTVSYAHAGDLIWWLAFVALGLAVGAIFAARELYNDKALAAIKTTHKDPLQLMPQTANIFALANARLMWDETYFRFVENPYNRASQFLAKTLDWAFWHDFVHDNIIYLSFHTAAWGLSRNIDRGAIDTGIIVVLGRSINSLAKRIRRTQTGFTRVYALTFVLGSIIILIAILLPVMRDLLGF